MSSVRERGEVCEWGERAPLTVAAARKELEATQRDKQEFAARNEALSNEIYQLQHMLDTMKEQKDHTINAQQDELAELKRSLAAEQKALEDAAKETFIKARPYLEAAHETNPEDIDTIRSLRDIYARTGQDELMLKMSGLLK